MREKSSTYRALAKKYFGAGQERLVRLVLVCAVVFYGLYEAEIHMEIRPVFYFLVIWVFTAGVMWQTLFSESTMENMQNLFMLPFEKREMVFSCVEVLGLYTVVTKTLPVLAVLLAVSGGERGAGNVFIRLILGLICAAHAVLAAACVCYADDFVIFGRISNLRKAVKDTVRWTQEALGLTIKDAWQVVHFASFDQERQQWAARRAGSRQRTPGVDMMGYVVRRTYTVIRGKNFVRIRRQFLRAARELDALGYVPWWRARTLCAYWGQLKYTDSIYFCQTYDAYRIFKAARRSVAWKARKEAQRGAVCQAAG